MALGDVIARLSVSLGMETASFDKGAKSAETTIGRLKNFLLGPGGIAVAAIGAAAGLAKLGIEGLKTADEISKAAQSIGIGTEELSRLKYAADLSDVSFEGLQKSVARLSRNMADAADGVKLPAKAFDLLHISVTNSDGTLRGTSDVIGDVADRFSHMDDGARKTALAMQIFGRSGAEMIPMLNEGREGLKKLTDEASKFGIVIDEETGKRAEAFHGNIERLKGAANALATELAADLLPYLLAFTNWLVSNAGTLRQYANSFGATFRNIISWIGAAINKLADWAEATNKVQGALAVIGAVMRHADKVTFNPIDVGSMRAGAASLTDLAKGVSDIPAVAEPATLSITALGDAGDKAGKRGAKGIKGISDAAKQAKQDADDFAHLLDRLFPERAQTRQFEADLASLDAKLKDGRISADDYAQAYQRLWAEFGKATAPPALPELDFGTESIAPKIDDLDKRLGALAGHANDNTVRIAKSFKDMADQTLQSLDRVTQAIKGGGFLNILSSLIGLGMQLGSIGAFGKTIAGRINTAVPGHAAGTMGAASGLAWVGERGPELVNFRGGERVFNNRDSMKMGGGVMEVRPSPLFEVYIDGKLVSAAPAIASAGGAVGVAKMQYANTRRVG